MGDVYDVDKTIDEQADWVKLRGKLYRIADFTVDEKVRHQVSLFKRQAELEASIADMTEESEQDAGFDALREVITAAVQLILVDVPTEVAGSVTEREFAVIQKAAQRSRLKQLQPLLSEEDFADLVLQLEAVEEETEEEDPEGKVSGERVPESEPALT